MPTVVRKAIRTAAGWASEQAKMEALYGVGGYYTTLQLWENAIPADLTATDEVWEAVCYNDWPTGAASVDIDGHVTDATRYISITVAEGHRHSGLPRSGFWIKVTAGYDSGVLIADPYTRLSWLDIVCASNDSNGITWTNGGAGNLAVNCLIGLEGTQSGTTRAGYASLNGDTLTLVSCVMYGAFTLGPYANNYSVVNLYNCVIYGAGTGFLAPAGSGGTAINSVAFGCTTNWGAGSWSAASTNNATGSATDDAPGDGSITGITSADFVDAAGGNFRLSSNSRLIGKGRNLWPTVTHGIDGKELPRVGDWDIGAFYVGTPRRVTAPWVHLPGRGAVAGSIGANVGAFPTLTGLLSFGDNAITELVSSRSVPFQPPDSTFKIGVYAGEQAIYAPTEATASTSVPLPQITSRNAIGSAGMVGEPWGLLIRFLPATADDYANMIVQVASNSNSFYWRHNAGTVGFCDDGGQWSTATSPFSSAKYLGKWTTAVLRRSSSTQAELWLNGEYINTTTISASFKGIGAHHIGSAALAYNLYGGVSIVATFGFLSSSQAASLSRDPWQLFAPRRQPIYSLPPIAGKDPPVTVRKSRLIATQPTGEYARTVAPLALIKRPRTQLRLRQPWIGGGGGLVYAAGDVANGLAMGRDGEGVLMPLNAPASGNSRFLNLKCGFGLVGHEIQSGKGLLLNGLLGRIEDGGRPRNVAFVCLFSFSAVNGLGNIGFNGSTTLGAYVSLDPSTYAVSVRGYWTTFSGNAVTPLATDQRNKLVAIAGCVSAKGGVVRASANGGEVVSDSAGADRQIFAVERFINVNPGNGFQGFTGIVYLACNWHDRYLSDSELMQLSADPMSVIDRSALSRIYVGA